MIEQPIAHKRDAATLVVGLGKTGLSCVRHLRSLGRRVAVVDSRPSPPALSAVCEEFPEVPVTLGGFFQQAFQDVGDIVVSPGVSLAEPALEFSGSYTFQPLTGPLPAPDPDRLERQTLRSKSVVPGADA